MTIGNNRHNIRLNKANKYLFTETSGDCKFAENLTRVGHGFIFYAGVLTGRMTGLACPSVR